MVSFIGGGNQSSRRKPPTCLTGKSLKILSHNVVSSTPRLNGMQTHNVSVIGTDCIGSCKSILELNSLVFFAGFRFTFLSSFCTHTIAVTISFDTSTGELLDPACTSFSS